MKSAIATRAVHSRVFGISVGALTLLAVSLFFLSGMVSPVSGDKGLALKSANEWISSPSLDFIAGLAGSGLTLLAMWLLNKVHNVLRSVTSLYIAFFTAMQAATPDLAGQFYTGTVLAVLVPFCMLLLFSVYRSSHASYRVFLIFLLLSFFTATQYVFAVYVPVFLLGIAQMGVFNRRTMVAALLGLITPWWLMLGFGVIDLADIHMPHIVNIFTQIDTDESIVLLVAVGFTSLCMLVCFILNVLRTIAYNARARAVNGAFTVTGLVTLIAMCVDYANILSYIPLLNFCAAMECTHYFSTHRADKSYIAIAAITVVYAALYLCQTVI